MLLTSANIIRLEPVVIDSRVNRCKPLSRLFKGYSVQHNTGPKDLDKPELYAF